MIRVGLVGYGYWGPNLARNLAESPGVELLVISDADPARRALASRRHAGVTVNDDVSVALDRLDALVVATPPAGHHAIALRSLEAGKHVLVAKPLAQTVLEAEELAAAAEARGLVLMVDHTFVHTGAVRELARVAPSLGRPLYYDSQRVNLGLIQRDADVLWDLAPHDLSIIRAVLPGERPVGVACAAEDRTGNGQADVAWLTVWHESGFVAHAHLSWLSPVKVRRALLSGDRRTAVYDDMEPSEKVKLYDCGVELRPGPETHRALVDYRTGDCHAPHLDFTEALAVEVAEFETLIRAGDRGALGRRLAADAGVEVVRLLEAAGRSRADGGCRVPIT